MIHKTPCPLVLACALAYFNSFPGAFQSDDYNVIVNNSLVYSWSAWLTDLSQGIRPLLKLTYTSNRTLGWGVVGIHLFNLKPDFTLARNNLDSVETIVKRPMIPNLP